MAAPAVQRFYVAVRRDRALFSADIFSKVYPLGKDGVLEGFLQGSRAGGAAAVACPQNRECWLPDCAEGRDHILLRVVVPPCVT